MPADEFIMAIRIEWEAVFVVEVIQDGKIDYHQFLIEIHLTALIYRIQIDGRTILQKSLWMCDGLCPIDFVVAAMLVFDDKEEEILVVLVKLFQRKENV